jgi:hypothetical protein
VRRKPTDQAWVCSTVPSTAAFLATIVPTTAGLSDDPTLEIVSLDQLLALRMTRVTSRTLGRAGVLGRRYAVVGGGFDQDDVCRVNDI